MTWSLQRQRGISINYFRKEFSFIHPLYSLRIFNPRKATLQLSLQCLSYQMKSGERLRRPRRGPPRPPPGPPLAATAACERDLGDAIGRRALRSLRLASCAAWVSRPHPVSPRHALSPRWIRLLVAPDTGDSSLSDVRSAAPAPEAQPSRLSPRRHETAPPTCSRARGLIVGTYLRPGGPSLPGLHHVGGLTRGTLGLQKFKKETLGM